MTILGINPFHNGSVCVLIEGEVIEYIEEERLTRQKYDELPFKSILKVLEIYSVDLIAISGLNTRKTISSYFEEEIIEFFCKKLGFKKNQIFHFDHLHHITHIAHSFYNSNFSSAIGIVMDGGGSTNPSDPSSTEADSIFSCSYPHIFSPLYKNYKNRLPPLSQSSLGVCSTFETLGTYLGFNPMDAGKIMGLSSYGNPQNSLPQLFKTNSTDVKHINYEKLFNDFFPEAYNIEWHHDKSKITDLEKDLAWKLQTESQTIIGNYVEKAIQETKLNNVVVAGGYGLNCVANYYLKKRFPKVNFYFEPIAHDGGTAIGAAKLLWHEKTQDTTIRPFKSLYLGKQYFKEELLEGIKKYVDTPQ